MNLPINARITAPMSASTSMPSETSAAERSDGMVSNGDFEGHEHFELVRRAIDYLRTHQMEQPTLTVLARELGVSEAHLQKKFSAWAGVSPKRFLQVLNQRYARKALRERHSVLDTSLELQLAGPSRLHDLAVACDAMTPGEIASEGAGLNLSRGWATSPFGPMLLGWSERGVCELSFHDTPSTSAEKQFVVDWSGAEHKSDPEGAQRLARRIFAAEPTQGTLHLLLRGTNFQVKVWEALIALPAGELTSYQSLADSIGAPRANRAVGSALARNRIGYLIPCHRVIRQSGDWGNYRWGLERRLAMHLWEAPN